MKQRARLPRNRTPCGKTKLAACRPRNCKVRRSDVWPVEACTLKPKMLSVCRASNSACLVAPWIPSAGSCSIQNPLPNHLWHAVSNDQVIGAVFTAGVCAACQGQGQGAGGPAVATWQRVGGYGAPLSAENNMRASSHRPPAFRASVTLPMPSSRIRDLRHMRPKANVRDTTTICGTRD